MDNRDNNRQLVLADGKFVLCVSNIRKLAGAELEKPELAGISWCADEFAVVQVDMPERSAVQGAPPPQPRIGLVFMFNKLYYSPRTIEYLGSEDLYHQIYWQGVESARLQSRANKAGISLHS